MATGLPGNLVTVPRPGLNALQHSASAIPAGHRRNQAPLARTNAATASACSWARSIGVLTALSNAQVSHEGRTATVLRPPEVPRLGAGDLALC
jgi:hypothetical protein